jgi:hypothetical protein
MARPLAFFTTSIESNMDSIARAEQTMVDSCAIREQARAQFDYANRQARCAQQMLADADAMRQRARMMHESASRVLRQQQTVIESLRAQNVLIETEKTTVAA